MYSNFIIYRIREKVTPKRMKELRGNKSVPFDDMKKPPLDSIKSTVDQNIIGVTKMRNNFGLCDSKSCRS